MATDATNREAVRDAVASGLTTALVGTGKPVKAVYGYRARNFENQTPVLVVMSRSSRRKQWGLGTQKYITWHRVDVLIFVRDPIANEGWTDADVEDRLDLIEKEVADWVGDNRETAYWNYLEHVGDTETFPATVGGKSYTMERITLEAEVRDA